ncbi:hypothetical protein QBC33DRAFT_560598 [Phialemonium atrogriseum]|uniref:Uncharacterized protein n=1 Tax=Phialemonium atrogriseum TaxID=1093897 RepID=A0AAJ0BXH3_9PEZI|nr:uncharacterized protein QBC33DRAFT_560598 [Phialemonium atrogriseum]KAK1765677.1 hypothetical protein QBC33DRAFT_560598 [Phialemonium atrogriseum]
MHHPISLLLCATAILAAAAATAQLVPPPTLTCGACKEGEGGSSHAVKWCQRCYMSPVHCSLEFSVPCNSTVDRVCPGDVMGCVHEPGDAANATRSGDTEMVGGRRRRGRGRA